MCVHIHICIDMWLQIRQNTAVRMCACVYIQVCMCVYIYCGIDCVASEKSCPQRQSAPRKRSRPSSLGIVRIDCIFLHQPSLSHTHCTYMYAYTYTHTTHTLTLPNNAHTRTHTHTHAHTHTCTLYKKRSLREDRTEECVGVYVHVCVLRVWVCTCGCV